MIERRELTPTMSGNTEGTPLYEYFRDKLPPDLPLDVFKNLSCYGYSRLIVGELGGSKNARIFRVEQREHGGGPEDIISHAYVVSSDSDPDSLAFNNTQGAPEKLTVREVKDRGVDVTEEMFSESWEKL